MVMVAGEGALPQWRFFAETEHPMHDALSHCLTASPESAIIRDLEDWRNRWPTLTGVETDPVALALRSGFEADRIGWAFAGGYQAALRTLLARFAERPAGAGELFALCATESGGNRPRDIQTTLTVDGDTLIVSGEKSWTTLGAAASAFLVVGRLPGTEEGVSPSLKVALVPAEAAGISFQEKPPIAFVPEIPHTASRFDNVALDAGALLPGDGYSHYVKPFRTVEDTFIALAVQACLLREARARGWPAAFREALVTQLYTLGHLAGEDPTLPVTHLALAGALDATHRLYDQADLHWRSEEDDAAQRWRRDRPLFKVASKPRALRAQRAWQALSGPRQP